MHMLLHHCCDLVTTCCKSARWSVVFEIMLQSKTVVLMPVPEIENMPQGKTVLLMPVPEIENMPQSKTVLLMPVPEIEARSRQTASSVSGSCHTLGCPAAPAQSQQDKKKRKVDAFQQS